MEKKYRLLKNYCDKPFGDLDIPEGAIFYEDQYQQIDTIGIAVKKDENVYIAHPENLKDKDYFEPVVEKEKTAEDVVKELRDNLISKEKQNGWNEEYARGRIGGIKLAFRKIKQNNFSIVKQSKIAELAEKIREVNHYNTGKTEQQVINDIKEVLSEQFPAAPESKQEPTPSEVEELAKKLWSIHLTEDEWNSKDDRMKACVRAYKKKAKYILSHFTSYEKIEGVIYDFFIEDGCNEEYSKRTTKKIINKLKGIKIEK